MAAVASAPTTVRTMSGQVHLEITDAVATITLDHQERRNAISRDMWVGLLDAATRIADDDTVRVAVIRGAGDVAFASGADISQFGETRADGDANTAYDATTDAATAALARLEIPTIAAVHGFCIGGGLAVALTTDLRISADDGRFGIPAARLGVGYAHPGIRGLIALVGPSHAKRILFTGDRFDAHDALGMGLINEVVPKAELDERVATIARTIAGNAPLTIKAAKMAVTTLLRDPDAQDFAPVEAAVHACFESEDYREGVAAFMEKRRPEFRGR